mmetsp:Transcript_71247/g.63950  ORF Transcript_71247/g.63950 Transcript_71247/m.63950 type:complete len:139 (+) Transcript_71247:89-505(+)
MIYFILAALFFLACNGSSLKESQSINKSQLSKLDFIVNSADFDEYKESLTFRNSTTKGAVCISSSTKDANGDALNVKDCPCTFLTNDFPNQECTVCAFLCDFYFGFQNICCDGSNCCCYEEPSPCNSNPNCQVQCCTA